VEMEEMEGMVEMQDEDGKVLLIVLRQILLGFIWRNFFDYPSKTQFWNILAH
jgi:hypothetical protein